MTGFPHPLFSAIAGKLADKLHEHRIAVWFDPRREFEAFVNEWRRAAAGRELLPLNDISARLVVFDGSFFEVRLAAEPVFACDEPEPLVIYLAGKKREPAQSILLELEKAGYAWEGWKVKAMAREVLGARYTEGAVDEWLAGTAGYEELAKLCAQAAEEERPSLLRAIFDGLTESTAIVAAWIASAERDTDIDEKGATAELRQLLAHRAGLPLQGNERAGKMRAMAATHILGAEFRADLRCEIPASLASIPRVARKEQESFVRDVASELRREHAKVYEELADRVEVALRIAEVGVDPLELGSIDTFRHEERSTLRRCGELIAEGEYTRAIEKIREREEGFWVERDLDRRALWRAARLVAELGSACAAAEGRLSRGRTAKEWVEEYTAREGMHQVDLAFRKAEALLATIDEGDDVERAAATVRRRYEDLTASLADRFLDALERSGWSVPDVLHQTAVFDSIVRPQERRTAYFLVDAFRFEMGAELATVLARAAEVQLRPVVAAIPTITPIGMGALQPEASKSFEVAEQKSKFGVMIEGTFAADAVGRRKFMSNRVPAAVDLTLDRALSLSPRKLPKEIGTAPLVIVRSTEIDSAGESGYTWARSAIETMIGNLARAVRKLASAGIEVFVISADHGHLFSVDRDESQKIEPPNGERIELHRRCWIGRGGETPAGTIRVSAAALGYRSDLDFVFPRGLGVFKALGDAAFHHGGLSLQELVVPLLVIRPRARTARPPRDVRVNGVPDRITNRLFSVVVSVEDLFTEPLTARVLLLADGREAGRCELVTMGTMDREGNVILRTGEPATLVLLLSDERAKRVRLSIVDDCEFELWGTDIPVELGVS